MAMKGDETDVYDYDWNLSMVTDGYWLRASKLLELCIFTVTASYGEPLVGKFDNTNVQRTYHSHRQKYLHSLGTPVWRLRVYMLIKNNI